MNQLSLLFENDDPQDCYLINDPVEELEMHYPRETLIWLLKQQYGPEAQLTRTKETQSTRALYKCPCAVHYNEGDFRGLVYLDQQLRVYCQSCKATRTLPQLLEDCETDPADVLKHVLENLEEFQQSFELLGPDVEEQLNRSWQGDVLTESTDLPLLEKTTHINPPLPPSVDRFDCGTRKPEITIPDSWHSPPELEQTLLAHQRTITTAATWTGPELQSPTASAEQDPVDIQCDKSSSSEASESKDKPEQRKSTSSLIGIDDAQSDHTLVITTTAAERAHLLTCEKFQPVVIAPSEGSINEHRDKLLLLPALNYLLVIQKDLLRWDLARFLFQRTHKPVMQLEVPKDHTLLEITKEELAVLTHSQLLPGPKVKASAKALPVVTSMREILERDLPPRRFLLDPLMPEQSIILVAAGAGTGKTFFAMEIAFAVATGNTFLDWAVPEPAGVLYVDGELPLILLQERLQLLEKARQNIADNFKILTRDDQVKGIPCLSTREGQEFIEKALQPNTKLIVLDNISTLVRSGLENESRSWQPVQDWTLEMRLRGYSILFVHHTGKSGDQRGTSSRIDTPDGALKLTALEVSADEKVTSMMLSYIKPLRHAPKSKKTEPRKLLMMDCDWSWEEAELSNRERIRELYEAGWRQKDIANELGISASAVCQVVKKLQAEKTNNNAAWSKS